MKITPIPEPVIAPKTDRDMLYNLHQHQANAFRNLAKKNWFDPKLVKKFNAEAEKAIRSMKKINPQAIRLSKKNPAS